VNFWQCSQNTFCTIKIADLIKARKVLKEKTCFKENGKGTSNQQKANILPKARKTSNQYSLKRILKMKKQPAKNKDSTRS